MASIKRRDTKPELMLRKELWRRGIRGYRLDVKLPGRPDIFFSKFKLCIFVDGCFWHGCPVHYKRVERNKVYWDAKIKGNRLRDRTVDERLAEMGFTVMRFWDHEITGELTSALVDRLEDSVRRRNAP